MRDDNHPYLAYSPEFTIKDSSEPFRAFLGAILSVVRDVPVEGSTYSSDMELDAIEEEEDDGPLPEDDIDNDSGAYQGSSSGRATGSRKDENNESELIVRPFLSWPIFIAWVAYLLLGYFVFPEFA